ncbi:3' terminal RNA ribose 2'-O-methyltransferase Hen1 [Kineococcus sp. R8]|uniref:3' terminal RNA ribose 2'-O-methyltransferase Hen1 n=1 Tax=Kineococcus siccus TaxID=2696567 RepID=UPI00141267FE|nr:3' terminal RNA ribose 2'-O-methyltransferase Hen1 [Kineococcus siccus]
MILTLTASGLPDGAPADDLGFLLHKHPARVQRFDLPVGAAHVFYPEVSPERCTAALLLEVDPVALARGRARTGAPEAASLGQHVNDRPYAVSSLFAVALSRVFGSAMAGRCASRPELAAAALPLQLRLPAVPCRGGADLLRRLLEPLGWDVGAREVPLDDTLPAWGASRYLDVTLTGTVRLSDALRHLYVLLPVLDDTKHYWVSPDEVDKLVRSGQGWLATHPEKDLVVRRYLAHLRSLTDDALSRLADDGPADDGPTDDRSAVVLADELSQDGQPDGAAPSDAPVTLAEQRRVAVLAELRAAGASRVADLGCGEGRLVAALLAEERFTEVVATDVSVRALQALARVLRLDGMPEHRRRRLQVFQSSLTYRDRRLRGLDAAVLVEVVEHVDRPRLQALERVVFAEHAPATVVVTTPNVEHNVRYATLTADGLRHPDHRFEFTRAEFLAWAQEVGGTHGYAVRVGGVGPDDPEVGPPSQLAVFTRTATTEVPA